MVEEQQRKKPLTTKKTISSSFLALPTRFHSSLMPVAAAADRFMMDDDSTVSSLWKCAFGEARRGAKGQEQKLHRRLGEQRRRRLDGQERDLPPPASNPALRDLLLAFRPPVIGEKLHLSLPEVSLLQTRTKNGRGEAMNEGVFLFLSLSLRQANSRPLSHPPFLSPFRLPPPKKKKYTNYQPPKQP